MKTINMKKGFTMIELVFVIVIIGILSAVALPRFFETTIQAHDARVEAFVGTLNRTTGPTLWARSLNEDLNGDVTSYCPEIQRYIDFIPELSNDGDCTFTVVPNSGSSLSSIEFTNGNANKSPNWRAL